MFKFVGNFLAKVALPAVIRNLSLEIDTVLKSDAYYLKIIVTAFGFTLLDELIKLTEEVETHKIPMPGKALRLQKPVDIKRVGPSLFDGKGDELLKMVTR